MWVLIGSALAPGLIMLAFGIINRWAGALLLAAYAGYTALLVVGA